MLHQEIVEIRHAVRGTLLLPRRAWRWLALARWIFLLLAVRGRQVWTGWLVLILLLQICRRVARLQRELLLSLLALGGLNKVGRVRRTLYCKPL